MKKGQKKARFKARKCQIFQPEKGENQVLLHFYYQITFQYFFPQKKMEEKLFCISFFFLKFLGFFVRIF